MLPPARAARDSDPEADVTLLLEGTYPYVSGGVSSWVHQILLGLPELRFALCFIGGKRGVHGEPRYKLPPNVIHLEAHYLDDPVDETAELPGRPEGVEAAAKLHRAFRTPGMLPEQVVRELSCILGRRNGTTWRQLQSSDDAWQHIVEEYQSRTRNTPFLDYFWSVRAMHAPIYRLSEIADALTPARVYHSISTGYAGLLGALVRFRRGRPFLITEHGIYTKERKIDLAQAAWLQNGGGLFGGDAEDGSYLRGLWGRFFEGLGRCAYSAADPIISLYAGNRQRQFDDGAEASRTRVVPNGVNVQRFLRARERVASEPPPILGLLGRVVPIKDTRTFIRAMAIVCARRRDAEGWIIGPTEEDPAYFSECEGLVRQLRMEERVRFLGFQRPEEILPRLGVMVLTSISEALPLVMLEAFAAGVPVVCTDVGACRELIEGSSPEDRALGAAGAVTSIAAPEETARAALALVDSETAWRSARDVGIARVERFYTETKMLETYREIYREAMQWQE
jgi:glycosyltransferase involved in cell wall biosynthesis